MSTITVVLLVVTAIIALVSLINRGGKWALDIFRATFGDAVGAFVDNIISIVNLWTARHEWKALRRGKSTKIFVGVLFCILVFVLSVYVPVWFSLLCLVIICQWPLRWLDPAMDADESDFALFRMIGATFAITMTLMITIAVLAHGTSQIIFSVLYFFPWAFILKPEKVTQYSIAQKRRKLAKKDKEVSADGTEKTA